MKTEEGFVLDVNIERVSKEIEAEIDALHPPEQDEEKKSEGGSTERSNSRDIRM